MSVSVVDWPAGVPNCVIPTSPQGGLRDNRSSFDPDNKFPPIERPASSWSPEVYSVEMNYMSVDQFSDFQSWYKNELKFGVNAFVMPHPITGVDTVWKIVKNDPPYTVSKVSLIPGGSDRRRVAVAMSIMSLPIEVPIEEPPEEAP